MFDTQVAGCVRELSKMEISRRLNAFTDSRLKHFGTGIILVGLVFIAVPLVYTLRQPAVRSRKRRMGLRPAQALQE